MREIATKNQRVATMLQYLSIFATENDDLQQQELFPQITQHFYTIYNTNESLTKYSYYICRLW